MKVLQNNCKKLSEVRTHEPTNTHTQCVGSPVTEKKFGMFIRILHMHRRSNKPWNYICIGSWMLTFFYEGN